jgi:hypothetical protein
MLSPYTWRKAILADLTKVGLKPEQTTEVVSNSVKIPRMELENIERDEEE